MHTYLAISTTRTLGDTANGLASNGFPLHSEEKKHKNFNKVKILLPHEKLPRNLAAKDISTRRIEYKR